MHLINRRTSKSTPVKGVVVIFDNTDFAPEENANGSPSNIILFKHEKNLNLIVGILRSNPDLIEFFYLLLVIFFKLWDNSGVLGLICAQP